MISCCSCSTIDQDYVMNTSTCHTDLHLFVTNNSAAEWQVMCIFKALHKDPHQQHQDLSLNEFYSFYEVRDLKWKQVSESMPCLGCLCGAVWLDCGISLVCCRSKIMVWWLPGLTISLPQSEHQSKVRSYN